MAETGPAPDDAPEGLLLHRFPTFCAGLLTVIAIVWVLEIPSRLDVAVFIEQMLAAVAGLGLCVAFLTLPARSGARRDRVPWYDEPTATTAFLAFLTANEKMTDETAYGIVKMLHGSKPELVKITRALDSFDPEGMTFRFDAEYHPGAIRFYKEVGQWPPK